MSPARKYRNTIAIAVAVCAAWAPGAGAVSAEPGVPFTIVGDTVTIYDGARPVSVSLRELIATSERLDTAKSRDGVAAAHALHASLPDDLKFAVAWDTVNVVEVERPPEEEAEKVAPSAPEEPPAQMGEPVRTVDNTTAGNYVTPSPVCTVHNAKDTRQFNGLVTRRTKYKLNIDVYWRGCDNGVNWAWDPQSAFYSDEALGWECYHDAGMPTLETGPEGGGPHIVFHAFGQCGARIDAGKAGTLTAGRKSPNIRNTYDWAGHRVARSGDAG